MASDNRFAVLIDADNVSVKYIKIILDEISKDGIATYKRIYGDWTNPSLISWKSTLLDNSIIPVQQYSYTTGKNSTDSTPAGWRASAWCPRTATSPGWRPGCGSPA